MKKNKGYIIPHTHWDREWRYPIWKNRMLLIEFMDELLNTLEQDKEYRYFLFDGQVVPIDDYLQVKPENREKLLHYIKEGRIGIGPWYTLPDLYPLEGECLVRNLLTGIRVSKKYGSHLKVGYNSFGWGQTAQLPQIYAGFGIDFIVCAKKVSEERAPQSEFWWEAPDGTKVLTSRLGKHARANFYFNAYLKAKYGMDCLSSEFKYSPKLSGTAIHNADDSRCEEDYFMLESKYDYDPEQLKDGIKEALSATDATAFPEHRLLLDGTDFSTPHPELSAMIEELNQISEDTQFINCNLEEYARALLSSAIDKDLRVIKGELRDGPSCDCSGNALASRAYLKILNKKVQNTMIHSTEPLFTAAYLLNGTYEKGYLDRAWRYLLEAHPHDSINGVTQDKTADDVEYRLNQALEMSRVSQDQAAAQIIRKIGVSAKEEENLIVVFNPHLYPVTDIIKVCVNTPQSDNVWDVEAFDSEGNQLELQAIARDEKNFPVHDLEARPWPYATDRHHLFLNTGEVPSMGYKVIHILPKSRFNRTHYYWIPMRTSIGQDICKTDNVLENEYLKVMVNSNGTIDLYDKIEESWYKKLHYFEDAGDVGNYWAYYPPYHNKIFTTLTGEAHSWCEDNGPLSATIGIKYTMQLPQTGYESKFGIRGEGARSEESVPFIINTYLTLKKGSKKLDIRTKVNNNVKNHRLRVAFPTGIQTDTVSGAGHFTVDERSSKPIMDRNNEYWPEMQTLPMQNFVDVSNKEHGLAILNDSMCEYEMADNDDKTLYLTLFRAMGNMIVTWWEAVGEFPDQSGSQCLREMEYHYSIYPHKGNWVEGNVYREAENLNVALSAYQIAGNPSGTLPEKYSLLESSNPNIILSALKKAEDRDSVILRLYNPTIASLKTELTLPENIHSLYRCNLNEDRMEQLSNQIAKTQTIVVGANEIITLELL